MISLKFAWENFLNDYNSSDNRLVRRTQFLLVFFLATLTLTSMSIQNYLTINLRDMLGSDMVVSRYQALSQDEAVSLRGITGTLSETQLLNVTLTHDGRWQKAQLKLVDNHYPVQGKISIGDELSGEHREVEHGPEVGEVWLDSRLFTKLNLTTGQIIDVGQTRLKVSALIFHEPDRLMEGHSVALRAMAHKQSFGDVDFAGTRKHFRYLIKANPDQQQQIEQWTWETLPDAQLIGQKAGHHPLALFWQRAENFIGLASVLLFFMAAIALDMASRRQLERQKYQLALCMSMGLEMRQGLVIALGQWIMSFLASLFPAILLAYAAEWLLIDQLTAQFEGIQFGWHFTELGVTSLLVLVLLLSFQIPNLLQLQKTSVVTLIRKQEQPKLLVWRLVWNIAGLALLATVYSDNMLLTGMTLGAMLASLALMMIITYVVLTSGEWLSRGVSGLLPFTFFIMKQRLLSKTTQIMGIGLCATLLLFTLMLLKDFGEAMEKNTRTHDGNLIITEAQKSQISAIKEWEKATDSQIRQLRPYTHAQLVNINDIPFADYAGKPSESTATLIKPIRMSWSETVPVNNKVTKGKWWNSQSQNERQISVESEIMTNIGINIGDRLTFHIGGKPYDFQVVAGHDYIGGKGSITFWFQVPPAAIQSIQPNINYMGSMELKPDAWPKLVQLWRQFPTLTLLPLKEITERYDKTLAMVQKLVLGFSSMIILMALVVIIASVKGYERDDEKKNGLLLSMGLSKWGCVKLSLFEWLITAFIASLGAIGGTWVAGQLIYKSQFSLSYQPDTIWTIATLVIIGSVVCGVGLFYCRNSLRASITQLLAE